MVCRVGCGVWCGVAMHGVSGGGGGGERGVGPGVEGFDGVRCDTKVVYSG